MKNPPIFPAILIACALLSCKKEVTETPDSSSAIVSEVDSSNSTTAFYNQKAIRANVCSNIAGYLEHLPKGYSSAKNYPLLICLHGIGELGNGTTEIGKLLHNSVPKLLQSNSFPAAFKSSKNAGSESFIVIAPQFKHWPNNYDVNTMLNYALKKYRVNKQRVYMIGLSMGGGVLMEYAEQYGKRLAAIVPMCEASYPTSSKGQAIAKTGVPVWAFHNQGDKRISPSYTINFVTYINKYHPAKPVFKTIFNESGHDCWTKATNPNYSQNNKNIYEWMLQYKRVL